MSFEFKMHIGENNYLHCKNLSSDELKKENNYHRDADNLDINKYMLKKKSMLYISSPHCSKKITKKINVSCEDYVKRMFKAHSK